MSAHALDNRYLHIEKGPENRPAKDARKKYAPPELVIYGSLAKLTAVGGLNDNLDFTFTGSRQTT
jgi:hypothetical protein